MTSPTSMPLRFVCSCGGGLRWELRETYRGTRWLGLCSRPECGQITTRDEDELADALRHFLLDRKPPRPYKPPWLRLFLRSSHQGFRWAAHHMPCWSCRRDLVMALQLDWRHDRPTDPTTVAMCLDCGAVAVSFWGADEPGAIIVSGEAWDDPTPPILALKSVLRDRAKSTDLPDSYKWDFA